MNLLKLLFGTKNDRELKRLWPIVREINRIEEEYQKKNLADEDFPRMTQEFRDRVAKGDTLDLSEVAALLEEDFKFAKDYPFAPKDAADALDNYRRALDLCGDIMANRIAPLAEETDQVGNTLNADGSVTRAPGMKLALELFGKTGLMGVTIPYYLGGLNMPCTILTACNDIVSRGDAGLMNLFGLQGIAATINQFGDEDLKRQYVPKLVTGEMTGAMVLTEPDAGSDLQSVKTTAHQDENGNWFVNGVKRFITNGCGEVLLVLARTEPEFSDGRGLSCLLVENGPWVKVRRLENKLGIHGSPTCEMVFTEAPAKLIGLRKHGVLCHFCAYRFLWLCHFRVELVDTMRTATARRFARGRSRRPSSSCPTTRRPVRSTRCSAVATPCDVNIKGAKKLTCHLLYGGNFCDIILA